VTTTKSNLQEQIRKAAVQVVFPGPELLSYCNVVFGWVGSV
jgi:hypothetical protein